MVANPIINCEPNSVDSNDLCPENIHWVAEKQYDRTVSSTPISAEEKRAESSLLEYINAEYGSVKNNNFNM